MARPLIPFLFGQLDAVAGSGRCSKRPEMASRGLAQYLGTLKAPLPGGNAIPPGHWNRREEALARSPTDEPGRGSPSPTPALRQAQRLGRIAGRSIGRRPGVVVGCQGCLGAASLAAGEDVVYGWLLGECILRWTLGIFAIKFYFRRFCSRLHVQCSSLVRSPCI